MSLMVEELYAALKSAGIDENLARAAARAVIGVEEKERLATKEDIADLRVALAEVKTDLIKWNVGALVALTAIFTAVTRWLGVQ